MTFSAGPIAPLPCCDPAALKQVSLVDILVNIVEIVAGKAHKYTVTDSYDLRERLGKPDPTTGMLTLSSALDNFQDLFRGECLQAEQVNAYVSQRMFTPCFRTFKHTEQHFRKNIPLSKILHRQFGHDKISEDEQSLKRLIFKALPASTQNGITSKLRDKADTVGGVTLDAMTLSWLKETCHILEEKAYTRSRSPSPYSRANAMLPPSDVLSLQGEGREGSRDEMGGGVEAWEANLKKVR